MYSTQPNAQSIFASTGPNAGFDARYELLELVARNGSSLVYRARDKVLDREVAIKTIKTQQFDEKKIVRFQAEAKTVSALNHQSLVRVLDFGINKTHQPYLVFDFVKGSTLAQSIQRHGPLPLEKAFSVITQICLAIGYAHAHGVVHRDLKSGNIMLTATGDDTMLAKVIDFGIAVVMEDSSRGVTLTPTGVIIGSPAYMSPEQILSRPADERSDIYSLACVLYEAIAGRVPFRGDSALDIMHKHVHQERPRLNVNKFPEGIGDALNQLFARALSVDCENRHQSIEEFHDHINEIWDKLESARKEPETPPYIESLRISDSHLLASQKDSQILLLEANNKRQSLLVAAMVLSVVMLVLTIFATIMDSRPVSQTKTADHLKVEPRNLQSGLRSRSGHQDVEGALRDLVVDSTDLAIEYEKIHPLRRPLSSLPVNLKELNLRCNDLSGVSLMPLTKMPLEALDVHIANLSSEGLNQIAQIRSLRRLNVSNNKNLSLQSFQNLKRLKSLQFFAASDCALTDEHVIAISQCKSINDLHISINPKLTRRSIEAISTMPALTQLHVTCPHFATVDLLPLEKNKTLRELKLDAMVINDWNAQPLVKIKQLKRLSLNFTDISPDGLHMLMANLPDLEEVSVFGCKNIEDQDLQKMRQSFSYCKFIDHVQF